MRAPTPLIVGGHDEVVLERNRWAQSAMRTECRLAIVLDATYLFKEQGALAWVAALARGWFIDYLSPAANL